MNVQATKKTDRATVAEDSNLLSSAAAAKNSMQTHRILMLGLTLAVIYQIILLIIVGWQNRYVLNHPDGVFYVRIASYYSNGQLDLAITGYWGPLFSWLIAPLLRLVEHPLFAARIVMGFSAVVFLLGCASVLRSFEIHPAGQIFGTWLVALVSVAWSVESTTPDLLMSGLMCFAIARMVSRQWLHSRTHQLAAGMFWGFAYLAKPVAFPLAFMIGGAITILWSLSNSRLIAMRSLVKTLFTFILIASPWILTLSMKYKSLVFSTSGKINHAVVGPPDVERFHPHSKVFHKPETGRMTAAEDPINMPYHYWSPFEKWDYAKYQLLLIGRNIKVAITHLSGFSSFSLGLLMTIVGTLLHKPWRLNLSVQRWRWGGIITACIVGIYLPVWAYDLRYYFPAYIFMLAASFGWVQTLPVATRGKLNLPSLFGFGVIFLCFAFPLGPALRYAYNPAAGHKQKSARAYEVAKKLRAADILGAVAGGPVESLYVAFYTNQPWHGQESIPTAERFKASLAELVIVNRYQAVVDELDQDSSFVNLDCILFGNKEVAEEFPLKVYRIAHP
ncbi:hypothetical protein HUU40_03935 [candidate division KSB1 bacterium]|nr:hypothetical protein [candidate division KSB1 bacterium]